MRRTRISLLLVLGMLAALLPMGAVAPALGASPGDIVVNEIIQNPSAVLDSAGEWFEVYNPGTAGVDIEGWTIADNDSDSHVIANGGPLVVPAGGYLVLGNNADSASNGGATVDYSYGGSWFLSNSADEVVLLDTALVEVDRVEYDGGPVFPDPTGASMALDDPANDNNVGANWCTASTPFGDGDFGTPGAANDCSAPPVPELVVNEIIQNPSAVLDSAGEWFEVYNPGTAGVDIEGWTIADNDSDSHVIANGGPLVVPAGGYLVLGNNADSASNGGATVDYSYGGSWFLSNSADEVVLLDTALVEVDRVEYDGGPVFPDPTGASMALIDPANDNNVGANWCTASTPFGDGDFGTPGAANDCSAPPVPELVVNEIIQNPSAVLDSAGEWFEVYNPGTAGVDIEGWTIADNDSDSHVIANGGPLVVSAGGYLVLGNNADSASNGGATVDYSYGGSWFLSNSADEVVLLDTALVEVDRVEYDGGPVFPDPTGASMALDDPANDNNVGANWCTASTPFGDGDFGTPGAANDCSAPPVPELVVNEIIQNPSAVLDSAGEWFEVYNPGTAGVDIEGWTIVDNDSDSHVIANGGPLVVPAGGYLVLGNNADSASNGGATVDYSYGGSWFLSNSADEVVLLDTALVEVDRVEYDGGPVFPDPTGASMALDDPANDNNVGANWCTASTPFGDGDFGTPGAANDCSAPPVPELVVNEIIQNPSAVLDSAGEWFEVYNPGTAGVDIEGWTIADNDSDSHVIANGGPLVVSAGGYLVLGNNADSASNGGATVDYSYGGSWFLSNSADEVVLLDTALVEVDRVEYDGGPVFPDPNGASMALIDPALDNNDGTNWCESGTAFGDGDLGSPGAANDCAAPEPTERYIHEVQGEGFVSPLVGGLVIIEGVVVGDFQDDDDYPNATYDNDIGGYHVQEEDVDADANPATSEGIFVRDNAHDIAVGDVVRVTGVVAESFGLTRIQDVTSSEVIVPVKDTTVTAASVTLPFTSNLDFESVEGMSVVLPQSLVISEYFNFDRFGEIVLTTERAAQPTAVYAPGSPEAAQLAVDNAKSRITLDDGRGSQNPDPAIHPNGRIFDLTNLFRGGDTVANVTGVMDYAFSTYKVQPTIAPDYTGGGTYTSINGRPGSPGAVGGDLTVATFNVLNYFTTLDNAGPICGPDANQGCRGADTAAEFTRQKTKIVSAIADIDADVVGLMEIENDAADVAVDDLVDGLNAATAPGTYANIVTGPVGPDAIRVALIYKPASVTPYGAHAVLAGAFLDPNELGDAKNRAALAQSFVDNANGGVFTVAVNHLKSKGSECGAGDDDPEQGSCNLTRTLAAGMLADWLQTDPTSSGDTDFLIIGDLNSYDKEDPINALAGRGYTDLVLRDAGEYAYSYVFSGQWGYLDYIMANGAAAAQVTGTTIWHINADEPDILDYDMSFKKPAQQALYEPNAFRSSDHDPVIVGLVLSVTPMQAKAHAIGTLSALLPTGSRSDDNRIGKAIESIEDSLNPAFWIDDFHLTDEGNKVFDEEKKAVKDLMHVDGPAETDAQAIIDVLVDADQTLAAVAIADAVAAGGDARYIEKAEQQMAAALDDLAWDKPDKAIDHYKSAWRYAQKALDDATARFATFNASLNRFNAGDLVAELSTPGSAQPATIAEIIQRNRPDVLLVNEFDYDAGGVAAELFQDNYLSMPQSGADPIVYPYRYVAPSNTGVPSGFDLDNNESIGGPGDAFGFGFFEGQYAFVVYSMYPIDDANVRAFQDFLWKDMPGALLPEDPDGTPWYTDDELDVFRLSSKNHVDVPINVNGETVHFLVSHPTPPVFDGPEDRNGTRNHDEIRFWADYVSGGKTARYIYDDAGTTGGLNGQTKFVIAGDLNSDPLDGDSIPGSAQQLLDHPNVNDSMTPSSLGGPEQVALQGGINDVHLSDPAFDTADFSDSSPGNLRADYVLPRNTMTIAASGVFWPETTDPLFPLVGTFPFPSSDHRLVWIDIDM